MKNKIQEQRRGEAGFTMVELIVVIIILGVLAATLLPKYMDVSGEAKAAVSLKMHGDINSTLHQVHGIHLAQQAAGATTYTPGLVTTCDEVLALLDDAGGVNCGAGATTLTFPDGRQAAFVAENITAIPTVPPSLVAFP